MTPAVAPPRRCKRSLVPWWFAGGFAVVIAANAALIVLSLSSFSGLETEEAYERGLAYNEVLQAAEDQAGRGWQTTVALTEDAHLTVRFNDATGQGVDGLSVAVRIVRPVAEGLDRTVSLNPLGSGLYGAAIPWPAAGVWEARIRAIGQGALYYVVERLWVPE